MTYSKPMSRATPGMTVRKLLKDRLGETERSPAELAEAAAVPTRYISDLISGRRRPPWPGRTDVYDKMTRFLKLGHHDLATCAKAEREAAGNDNAEPNTVVHEQIMALCDAEVADALKERAKKDNAEIVDLLGRVLGVVQSTALRSLDAQIPLRVAATRSGSSYEEMRMEVLEFLDTSAGTISEAQFVEFVRPHIENWTVDLETGVLRVTLRSAVATERHARKPMTNGYRPRVAG